VVSIAKRRVEVAAVDSYCNELTCSSNEWNENNSHDRIMKIRKCASFWDDDLAPFTGYPGQ